MFLSHSFQFIFIQAHRTGSTALASYLAQQSGGNDVICPQHANARTIEAGLLDQYADYYRFGFVRNPWARILSWYLLLHRNRPLELSEEQSRLEQFISTDACTQGALCYFHYNCLDYFSDSNGKLKVDDIYRFENFHQPTSQLFIRLRLPNHRLQPLNNNQVIESYQDYYTKRTQRLVADKCKKDICYFGYQF